MTNKAKGNILKGVAIGIDVSVPLAATFSQFPVWVERSSSATISGLFLVFAFFSILPFIKQIRNWLKSPSVEIFWLIAFVLFVALRSIIEEMVIICFFGAISNSLGAVLYRFGKKMADNDKEI